MPHTLRTRTARAAAAGLLVTGVATTAAPASAAVEPGPGRPLTTPLTGAAEAPDPGDPDGTGHAVVRVVPGLGQVCWTLTAEAIGTTVGAHIHRAPAGEAGPVVVPLTPPVSGSSSSGCSTVERALARELVRSPEAFYVNIHTVDFRPGAVRGQLG